MASSFLPKMIAVVGPTGSGKSRLALELAQALGGEIICTDSMQIYQKLNIGTAKPTAFEQACIPHHQLDLVPPDGHYSAGQYVQDTDRIIAQLHQQQKPMILVGGTGLYFRCVLFGICQTPTIPLEIKETIHQWHSQGLNMCYQKLQELDPSSSKKLHPNDTTRILRALEVVMLTGKSLQTYQQEHGFQTKKYSVLSLGLHYERKQLYERINQRTHAMLADGFVEEVRSLLKEYPSTLKPLQAIGYRQIVQFLQNELTETEMVLKIQQKTRNYAKRQISWFKNDSDIHWFLEKDQAHIVEKAAQFLKKSQ